MYYIVDQKHKDAPNLWTNATTTYANAPKNEDGTKFLIEFANGVDLSAFTFLGTAYTEKQLRPVEVDGEVVSIGALAANGFE